MSCFPKTAKPVRGNDIDDALKLAKLMNFADFARCGESGEKAASKAKQKKLPRYMQSSSAARKRNKEKKMERESRKADLMKRKEAEFVEKNEKLWGNKLSHSKLPDANVGVAKKSTSVEELRSAKKSRSVEELRSPENPEKSHEELKNSSSLPHTVKFDSVALPDPNAQTKVNCSRARKQVFDKQTKSNPSRRAGGAESFHFRGGGGQSVMIHQLEAKRCYRILTYYDLPEGRTVMDIPDGIVYFCRTGPMKRRITPNGVAYEDKQSALSERFPMNQVGSAVSGNGTSPRLLVAFDCWGESHRRMGGGGSSKYEFCKFIKIEQFLESPGKFSKKQADHPVAPHYYPRADRVPKSRRAIDRAIMMDRRFDTKPWEKPKVSFDMPEGMKDPKELSQ